MLDQDVFSKIIDISKEKTTFMLSEIIPDVEGAKKGSHTLEIVEKIQKKLPGLGLSIKKVGNDYEISTHSTGEENKKLTLASDDKKRFSRFFEEPKVPRPLDELMREYISKKTGKHWDDPVILERIRQAVIAQKGDYWREGQKKKVQYEQGYRIFAYLA
jgi:hypothetical protein